jgi:O-6-methylguanine DNA methyltransferase
LILSSGLRRFSFHSPLGMMTLASSDVGICALSFAFKSEAGLVAQAPEQTKEPEAVDSSAACRHLLQAKDQVLQYFDGRRCRFDVPLDLVGSAFQREVWGAVCSAVSFGQTMSYSGLARHMGRPLATRAVASALRANPVLILVPCHRVVASSGALSGYVAGVWRKAKLLQCERQDPKNCWS